MSQTVKFRCQMLMLSVMHISAWSCLIRSDYNFVLMMFAYFYIVSREDSTSSSAVPLSLSQILYLVILLQIMDVIFFLFVPSSWMAEDPQNQLWGKLKSMHGFAILCSVVVFVLKLPLLYYLYQLRSSAVTQQS